MRLDFRWCFNIKSDGNCNKDLAMPVNTHLMLKDIPKYFQATEKPLTQMDKRVEAKDLGTQYSPPRSLTYSKNSIIACKGVEK